MNNIKNKFTGKQDKPKPIQGDSLTQQHMSESTDINNMVKRYTQGGQINLNKRQPTFGVASAADFHTMQNAVADVRTQFNNLPSRLRSKFQNDPHMLLRWLENPANHDQAVKLGLIPPPRRGIRPGPNPSSPRRAGPPASRRGGRESGPRGQSRLQVQQGP